jgi:hypothetical protein
LIIIMCKHTLVSHVTRAPTFVLGDVILGRHALKVHDLDVSISHNKTYGFARDSEGLPNIPERRDTGRHSYASNAALAERRPEHEYLRWFQSTRSLGFLPVYGSDPNDCLAEGFNRRKFLV